MEHRWARASTQYLVSSTQHDKTSSRPIIEEGFAGYRVRHRCNTKLRGDGCQDVIGEHFIGLLVHSFRVVICAGDDDCHIETGKHGNFVSTVAAHVERGIALFSRFERLEPPEIAVLRIVVGSGMGLSRYSHPRLVDDPRSLPASAVQVKLGELQQIAAAHARRFLKHFAQGENPTGAVAEISSVGRWVDLFSYVHPSSNRQIEDELS